jgi:hypothetical protein
MLRPVKVLKDEYIFSEGDPIEESIFFVSYSLLVYFLIQGKAAYVVRKYDLPFIFINEGIN